MTINYAKLRQDEENDRGSALRNSTPIPLIDTTTGHIERVNTTKLLGIHWTLTFPVNHMLRPSWLVAKTTQRLYFLKQLTRTGVPQFQLRHFCLTVIRPVIEYASPAWHNFITKKQSDQIEAIQKRSIRIIYPYT